MLFPPNAGGSCLRLSRCSSAGADRGKAIAEYPGDEDENRRAERDCERKKATDALMRERTVRTYAGREELIRCVNA